MSSRLFSDAHDQGNILKGLEKSRSVAKSQFDVDAH
jgi:hypothetical protein